MSQDFGQASGQALGNAMPQSAVERAAAMASRAFVAERRLNLAPYVARARLGTPALEGMVTRVLGMMVEATAPGAAVGDFFAIRATTGVIRAEVVALKGDHVVLLPYGQLTGLSIGDGLHRLGGGSRAAAGPSQLGRVIDALGAPLDGGPAPEGLTEVALHRAPLALDEPSAHNTGMADALLHWKPAGQL